MTTTTTELPALLRGCVKWRDGRAWADDDALLIVADWCEDNDRPDDAEAIRGAMGWGEPAVQYHYDMSWGRIGGDPETCSKSGDVVVRPGTPDRPRAEAWSSWDDQGGTIYPLAPDETPPPAGPRSRRRIPHDQEAIRRIFGLARWDLVCHMLGWPPLRLAAGGGGAK
jgi:hypothetical protein